MSKLRDTINQELKEVQLSDDIKMNVLNSAYASKKKRFSFKPLAVAVASLCTASVLTVGVGAVAFGGVSEFINGMEIALQPVNETCTDNGIKVTVLSAGIDNLENKTMSAYITVEDITGLNRITEDSMFDGWIETENWNNNENSYANYSLVSYDEATHIATYKLVATMNWWSKFTNKDTLASHDINNGTTYENILTDVNLYDLAKDNLDASYTTFDYLEKDHCGFIGCYKSSSVVNTDGLKSIMENLQEPVPLSEDVNLIGIGFLDGHLHVKLEYNTNDRTNNQANEYYQEFKSLANIHLVGSEIGSSDNVSYLRADTGDTLIEELCFPRVNDISKLEGLKLTYDLETITYIQGEWRVTFKVSPSEE